MCSTSRKRKPCIRGFNSSILLMRWPAESWLGLSFSCIASSCRKTAYPEIWVRGEGEKQPQILPPRSARRQDDSAGRWIPVAGAEYEADRCAALGSVDGYPEVWERGEGEKQPQILPPRSASRQEDSAGRWVSVAGAECSQGGSDSVP